MKTLKCIVADDEPIAREILDRYIQEIPYLELVASCKDAFEVMDELQKQEVDLLLLDINMPKLSGLSLLKTMQQRPEVIITTAYPQYALEGFELSVADYLLKPFSFERFLQAIMKIQRLFQTTEAVEEASPQKEAGPQSIFVKSDKKLMRINLDAIQYIEAFGNYVKIYAETRILTLVTLTEFIEKLPPGDFIRIHKSYVINFNKLKLIEGNQLVLESGVGLPIGKSFRKAILERIER